MIDGIHFVNVPGKAVNMKPNRNTFWESSLWIIGRFQGNIPYGERHHSDFPFLFNHLFKIALSPLGCIWTDVAALLIKIPQRIDIRGDAVDLTGGNFLRHFIKRDCRERETYNKKDKSDCCVDVRFIDFHHDSPDGTYFSIRSCSSGTESRPAAYLL